MTLFKEIKLSTASGGLIVAIANDSVAEQAGLMPGDELLAINGEPLQDVIDVRYYGAEEQLVFDFRRSGRLFSQEAFRQYGQQLGLEFAHPTFDTDIRRCNNLCEFCFVLQMAPRFRRTLYIKDDDYRYSFLFGHYVTLTNLNDHDWWRIETMRLSPLYISVHVTDLGRRRSFLRNEDAPDILEQLKWLSDRGIVLHTQIVVVPEVNDGYWLDRSIDDLARLHPDVRSITVVPVGLTRHHKYSQRTHRSEEIIKTLEKVQAAQLKYRQQMGKNLVYLTDEWYLRSGQQVPDITEYDGLDLQENGLGMVRLFLDEWLELQSEIHHYLNNNAVNGLSKLPASLTLVTGTLFGPTLSRAARKLAEILEIKVEVAAVVNHRLGSTITVAGLLMVEDISAHLSGVEIGDIVVLPRVAFDHPQKISLDDISPQEIANQLGRLVALADSMGDIWDALLGKSKLLFKPEG